MNEKIKFFGIGLVVGIVLSIIFLGIFSGFGENRNSIRILKETQEELRDGYRGVEQALGITEGTIDSVESLISIAERERQTTIAIKESSKRAEQATTELRAIFESGIDIIDRLIEWAEENDY
jgi:hypothetical protein